MVRSRDRCCARCTTTVYVMVKPPKPTSTDGRERRREHARHVDTPISGIEVRLGVRARSRGHLKPGPDAEVNLIAGAHADAVDEKSGIGTVRKRIIAAIE